MTNITRIQPLKCRTVWLSDTHLGSRGCKADYLLDFLKNVECEYIYLVGDIFDIWSLKQKGFYWPQSHNNIIRTILGKAKHDTKIVYIPGNHDDIFREYDDMEFGNVKIHNKYIHHTVDGRKFLMMHGDEFDSAVQLSRLASFIGDKGYDFSLYINRYFQAFRRMMGFPYWSLSGYLKNKVQNAMDVISKYEDAVANEAKLADVDGVVCGHIHNAQLKEINGVLYCNDGDWVENCTTMIEHHDGTLELLRWREKTTTLAIHPPKYNQTLEKKIA
jgi:UDP-2,3-diacylglucosamine pyrophosphatase LpxH